MPSLPSFYCGQRSCPYPPELEGHTSANHCFVNKMLLKIAVIKEKWTPQQVSVHKSGQRKWRHIEYTLRKAMKRMLENNNNKKKNQTKQNKKRRDHTEYDVYSSG